MDARQVARQHPDRRDRRKHRQHRGSRPYPATGRGWRRLLRVRIPASLCRLRLRVYAAAADAQCISRESMDSRMLPRARPRQLHVVHTAGPLWQSLPPAAPTCAAAPAPYTPPILNADAYHGSDHVRSGNHIRRAPPGGDACASPWARNPPIWSWRGEIVDVFGGTTSTRLTSPSPTASSPASAPIPRDGSGIDARGKWISPSFIDAHVHTESALVWLPEFARAVVPHGTGAVVTDPHEIANVAGLAGMEAMRAAARGLPLGVFFTVAVLRTGQPMGVTRGRRSDPPRSRRCWAGRSASDSAS